MFYNEQSHILFTLLPFLRYITICKYGDILHCETCQMIYDKPGLPW